MNKKAVIIVVIIVILLLVIAVRGSITGNVIGEEISGNVESGVNAGNVVGGEMNTQIKLETNQGDIVIELREDRPITAGNFEKLVGEGFYDGVIFHRIINGFMIQGGDPTGTGTGGPGYKIQDEFAGENRNDRGTLSMANAGPNTGGSQFFINLVNNNFLDTKHSVFGEVVEGMEVVDKIAKVQVNAQDKPFEEVKIIKATVL